MTKRIAYLGPPGTHSEEAALRYAPDSELVPYPSLLHVASAVEERAVDEAIVPVENSIHGSITDITDFLIGTQRARIRHELVHRVRNCLLVESGTKLEDVSVIFSHPQPLGQCRTYLQSHLPGAELIPSASTASAILDLKSNSSTGAAISTNRAAKIYGLCIAAEDIDENPENATRFLIIAERDHPRTGVDRTSIAFDFEDNKSGLLVSALQPFAERNISLTKVESRPTGRRLGRYVFLLDFEGHRTDHNVKQALAELRRQASMVKVLGSYPRSPYPLTHASEQKDTERKG